MLRVALRRSCIAQRACVDTRAAFGARTFMAVSPLRKDLIQDLYLSEIRAYKPAATDAAVKVDLVDKFSLPTPPAKPEIEASVSETAVVEDAIEEEEWPPVYNPIDDPNNYNDEWEFRTEADTGKLLPERLKPYDYHDH
ncbi:hypothetical protein HDU67_005631 [Dinochytrium kinnereticum]|nr:hypothetical protein HDU67_005631 [Dinochytrium kinnereticum]